MKFLQETGALLNKQNTLLHFVEGNAGSVDFPAELILTLHKQSPGIVTCLSHVHPPYMNQLSSRDESTLKTLAKTLHPFPIHMEVIAEMLDKEERFAAVPYLLFSLTRWYAQLESEDAWQAREKKSPRTVTIAQVSTDEEIFFLDSSQNEYWDFLLRRAYR